LPKLFSLQRGASDRIRGSLFYPLFHFRVPVLKLSDAHRQLIWFALQNHSDSEIAALAGITLPAVKKRWSSLFDAVAGRRPELLPDPPQGHRGRGPEKRSALLNYVRLHPEELHPYAQSSRRRTD
jgi:hypothetical protein